MSVEDICTALSTQVGLAKQHVETFREHCLNGTLLSIMDEESMKEIGIHSSLERKKVIAWVMQQGESRGLAIIPCAGSSSRSLCHSYSNNSIGR